MDDAQVLERMLARLTMHHALTSDEVEVVNRVISGMECEALFAQGVTSVVAAKAEDARLWKVLNATSADLSGGQSRD